MDHPLLQLQACEHRLCLHGLAVCIQSEVPWLNLPVHRALGEFATSEWPQGFAPTPGGVRPYDESVVLRHLSPAASAVATGDELVELYEDGARFWLIDDRWGLCEINLLKGSWQSWILPHPRVGDEEIVDAAVLWPLAQLLRLKGLTLLPAAAITRDGFGVMIFSPFSIDSELAALATAGWQIVSQRWTALREEDGRVSMLRLPGGAVQRATPAFHSFCDAVILVDAARRGAAACKALRGPTVTSAVRRAWPIFDIHAQSRLHQLPARLAGDCAVFEAQLSRRPGEFAAALDRITAARVAPPARLHAQILPINQSRQIPA